jgi:hypothetical protein
LRSADHARVPILAPLQRILEAAPTGGLAFLLTDKGQPFGEAGFANETRQRCDEAGLNNCRAHGLRKTGAVIAAENGATPHQHMSTFGWLSLKQAEPSCTRAAQQKRLAGGAMKLLPPGHRRNVNVSHRPSGGAAP